MSAPGTLDDLTLAFQQLTRAVETSPELYSEEEFAFIEEVCDTILAADARARQHARETQRLAERPADPLAAAVDHLAEALTQRPAPVMNVTVPAPDVNVNVEQPPRRKRIERDGNGRPTEIIDLPA